MRTMRRSLGSFKSSDKAFLFCCHCARPTQSLLSAGPQGPVVALTAPIWTAPVSVSRLAQPMGDRNKVINGQRLGAGLRVDL